MHSAWTYIEIHNFFCHFIWALFLNSYIISLILNSEYQFLVEIQGAHNINSLPFRYAITKAFVVAFVMTFFSVFDVPVFWPILLCYWIVLFVLTMKRQIMHMIKYKYVPFNIGKQVSITAKFSNFCLSANGHVPDIMELHA
jgi:hypothetical protein